MTTLCCSPAMPANNGGTVLPDRIEVAGQCEPVCAYGSDAARYDLGTVAEYERAVADLDELRGALA